MLSYLTNCLNTFKEADISTFSQWCITKCSLPFSFRRIGRKWRIKPVNQVLRTIEIGLWTPLPKKFKEIQLNPAELSKHACVPPETIPLINLIFLSNSRQNTHSYWPAWEGEREKSHDIFHNISLIIIYHFAYNISLSSLMGHSMFLKGLRNPSS